MRSAFIKLMKQMRTASSHAIDPGLLPKASDWVWMKPNGCMSPARRRIAHEISVKTLPVSGAMLRRKLG
jgi:hypothetical protein